MSLPFINDTLGDLLNNYVHYITKQMQEIADALWGSENDNQDELITLPASIQTRGIFCICGFAVSDFSDYAPYTPSDFAHGNFYEVTSVNINYINGNLNIGGLNSLGRLGAYSWGNVNASCRDLAESIITDYISSHANDYIFTKVDYPTDPITYEYSSPNDTIFFLQNNEQHVFETTFPKYDGTDYTSDFCNIKFIDLLEMSGEYYVEKTLYIISENVAGRYVSQYGDGLFITNTNDQTFIDNYINDNGATHNYTYTYETENGDTVTIYYGDNYVITKSDPDAETTYNEYKNALDVVTNKINNDNDYGITVPTYKDNKYGPTPELISDNQEDGGNYNHAEFIKVYACTSAELNNLYQWMGGGAAGSSGDSPVTVPDNFDPMNRIVGLIGYPMVIDVGVGDATTFTFRNAANQTINTGWSTYKYGNFDREFDLGTVEIPNWEEVNNGAPFLDYAATVEIYIPFCGIVGLDPQAVMGCTLSCKMWIDFVTGDCSAVVYTNYGGEDAQHPVAFVSGNCGSAEVVSANAFGSYQGAKAQASHKMSQAILGGFKDLATSVIGGATTGFTRGAANPSGAGGSAGMRAGAIGSVIGGAMNLGVNLTLQNMDNRYAVQVAKNALGTTISGSFGQQTSWYYMDTPYIKVTWPTPISKDVELYGKTFGIPVHRSGALNEFTGYTVCNNVDVSGIAGATASELAIIKQFLETGVFIKEGGEE